MSKKRSSPDSNDDEQTNEGLDSIFQQDGNTKRAKLDPLPDTTIQDLPNELLEFILIKAVTMEVNDMKLAKSVWKEKSDLVISRLRTVCSQWSHILTNDSFRNELQRTFDALEMVRLEVILHQDPYVVPPQTEFVFRVISTMDQVFMSSKTAGQDYFNCDVYDRNNMAEVKDIFPLPGKYPPIMVASRSESNCVHVVCGGTFRPSLISILRIAKDVENRFTLSSLVTDMSVPHHTLLEAADSDSIFLKQQISEEHTKISVFDVNGSLQHEIQLSSGCKDMYKVIPRPNGNLVLVEGNKIWQMKLTEVNMDGTILRQYQSSIGMFHDVCAADKYGRILIANRLSTIELVDSEFNLMECTGPQLDWKELTRCGRMHYNRERNELVATTCSGRSLTTLRTVF